jgi:acetyl-CoA carboxylase biotin carboxyl carrier protein
MDLTNEDVRDILAAIDSLPYDEVDLQTSRFRLTLRRSPGGGWTEESHLLAQPDPVGPDPVTDAPDSRAVAAGGAAAPADLDTAGEAGASRSDADTDGLVAVVTPLPGTFYRAPRPGAAAFVEIGDTVGPDTVVAIVETMKLMNSVPAGTAGRVARISLENAEFAAQGATLMLIEPDA